MNEEYPVENHRPDREEVSRIMGTADTKTNKNGMIIEPVTTVVDEGKFVWIRAELPGIEEQKIRIELENNPGSITILAANAFHQFERKILLPYHVRFSNKRFSGGVLELAIEKIRF